MVILTCVGQLFQDISLEGHIIVCGKHVRSASGTTWILTRISDKRKGNRRTRISTYFNSVSWTIDLYLASDHIFLPNCMCEASSVIVATTQATSLPTICPHHQTTYRQGFYIIKSKIFQSAMRSLAWGFRSHFILEDTFKYSKIA